MGACLSINIDIGAPGVHNEVKAEMGTCTKKQFKLILLGTSDSGKSTVLKQMRILHNVEFTPQEIESYRQLVFNNIVRGAVMLVDALPVMKLQLSPENQRFAETLRNINDLQDGEVYPEELLQPLQDFWGDAGAQEGWLRANEVALPENLQYFFEDLPRVFQQDYVPTTQDIVWCRTPTIGAAEMVLKQGDRELMVVEIGGQRFARQQWVTCFKNVPAIVFLVSLSGYDQCVFQDFSVNRMQDAMDTWSSICDSKYTRFTNIILLFNKDDLFTEKVEKSPIKQHFPDYEGPEGDAAEGRNYFRERFLKLSSKTPAGSVCSGGDPQPRKREIYTHYTTATSDATMLRVIMTAVEGHSIRAKFPDHTI
ncbi:guanine nucleotide-binding protein alpha-2 subunit [Rhizoctonia solani 123E]|uniref:Guanine nucleotide-binding protein alpha-2 subunit n=1 Tax=Rhizoctonia solani 123E TaxID=1423351 RepID=A0A074S441_9AGAM|nr:guanine nucleotide-binding protein alpha-2 subunit [Rhizoctonia solani 123E]